MINIDRDLVFSETLLGLFVCVHNTWLNLCGKFGLPHLGKLTARALGAKLPSPDSVCDV